jgi:hypothetical protein
MAGGGGGGGSFSGRSPAELRDEVRKAEAKATGTAFEAELAKFLGTLLSQINDRDPEKVRKRLDDLKQALEESIAGTFDRLFGGSVAKHTYVDGLSDIDSIFTINGTSLEGKGPDAVLRQMERLIKRAVGDQATVTHGRMAVTVEYADGMVIQLLPAIRTEEGQLRVPSSRRDDWSRINPVKFQDALTKRNEECGKKLVPTIKLAKAIIGQLPEPQRLSGYHMESLAIAAFRGYDGQKTTNAMLPVFFERASALVMSPIKDRTGQSIHVDEYLGPAKSEARQVASHLLDRLARRMRNASMAGSESQWRSIFGLDE